MTFLLLSRKSSDGNYQVGDRLAVQPSPYNVGSNGLTLVVDSSNVSTKSGGTYQIVDKTAFTNFVMTASKWKLIATPYKLN